MSTLACARPGGRGLAWNFVLLSGGEFLAKLLTFAAFVYLGRVLGPDRYGSLEFVLATMVFFTLPVDFGIGIYGACRLAKDPTRAAELLREVAASRLLLAGVSFAVLLVATTVLPLEVANRGLLLAYGLSLFGEPALVQWFFQARERMHWVAAASLTRKGVFSGLVFLLVGPETPLIWVGGCEVASVVATGALCLAVLAGMGHRPPRPWVRAATLVAHLQQAAPIGLSEFAWAALWYCATLLLGLLVGGAALGWFGASHRLVMALHTFVWLYFFNLLPALARGLTRPAEHLVALVERSLALTAWAGVGVALGVNLIAGPALALVYGDGYTGAATLLAILVWVIPVSLLSGHYRYLLIAANHQRLEFACTAAAAACGLVLGAVLIPFGGVTAAAGSLLAANLVNFGLAYLAARTQVVHAPFAAKLIAPGFATVTTLAAFTAARAWGAWPAAVAAGLVYLLQFTGWAGLQHLAGNWDGTAPTVDPISDHRRDPVGASTNFVR